MGYVFEPASHPTMAVKGTEDRLPVRRIFCVGRNYAAHAREMGKDPDAVTPDLAHYRPYLEAGLKD